MGRIAKETTNTAKASKLLIKLKALQLNNLVNFKIVQIMHKVNNKQLLNSIQRLSQLREGKYHSRGSCIFKKTAYANKQYKININAKYKTTFLFCFFHAF